jgi:hypothetical protein
VRRELSKSGLDFHVGLRKVDSVTLFMLLTPISPERFTTPSVEFLQVVCPPSGKLCEAHLGTGGKSRIELRGLSYHKNAQQNEPDATERVPHPELGPKNSRFVARRLPVKSPPASTITARCKAHPIRVRACVQRCRGP